MTVSTGQGREKITALMASADEDVRLEAIRLLGQEAPEAFLDLLFQGFGDPSWRVRKEATELFLGLPARLEMAGRVIDLLHAEENAGLRNAAVDILVRLGRDVVPMLLAQARCPDHDVRKFIVDILGEIADPRAVPTLLEALGDDDGNVRAAAAENLGKLRATEAVPALLEAMRHPDVLLRFTILDALGKIGVPVPLERLLPFRDETLLRKALIDCLGLVGDASAIPELLAGLADPMRNVRDASLLGLAALGDRYPDAARETLAARNHPATVEAVLGYLDAGQPATVRRAAVRLLGWLASPRALLPLLQALTDETLQQDALPALVSVVARSPGAAAEAWPQLSSLQQAYLAYACGEAGCSEALPLLTAALASSDGRLAQMSAHAIGRLGGMGELEPLAACLRHPEGEVRAAAAQSLGLLGGRFATGVLAVLEPLLADADAGRRAAAVGIVGRLEGEEVSRRLTMALKDPAAEVRRTAISSLAGAAVADHLPAVQLALTDEDIEVRRAAAEILGTSSDPEALHGLRLAACDEDLWVRAAAVRSLGRLGGAGEAGTIAALLGDPVGLVSIAALETLADLLGEQACPQLVAALDHADEEVVNAALGLLSRHATGAWLAGNAETLLGHRSRQVRAQTVRLLVERAGDGVRPVLEQRLAIETDPMVRQQIDDVLHDLSAS